MNSSALSGPIEISGTFQQQLVPNGTIQCLTALKQGKKDVITPEVALLIQYKCPYALGHNLYSMCLLDQWMFWLGGV